MRFFITAFCFLLPGFALSAWDLNDVSYLLPLPREARQNHLLGVDAVGKGGSLLPKDLLATVPPLVLTRTEDQVAKALRVVAVRLDPCFPLPTPLACQKQVRLVWQPLEDGRGGNTQAVDAALHSFYEMTEEDFTSLLHDLEIWREKYSVQTKGLPLQVHPAWAAEKDQSPALQEFQEVLQTYIGIKNLLRVTLMVLRGAGDMWAFQSYEMRGGELQIMKIPRVHRGSQAFVNFAVPSDHFQRGQISPEPKGEDTLNQIIRNSDHLQAGNEDLIRREIQAVLRIENPKNFNSENMDCVSCHVAQPAYEWTRKKRSDLDLSDLVTGFGYKNPRYNLENRTQILGNTQMIRAFGYFIQEAAISQRVINESAEVADLVNAWASSRSRK